MNAPRIPVWLLPCIVLVAALSLWSISYRVRVEERNKAVSLALEYDTIESYAAAQGKPIAQALADLKAQGLGAVVLSEETLGDLASSGRVSFHRGGLSVQDGSLPRVLRGIEMRYPNAAHPSVSDLGSTSVDVEGPGAGSVRIVSVGLDPAQAAAIRSAGLGLIARMANPAGVTGSYVRKTIAWARELGASIFLPMGDQVLGRRDALPDLIDALRTEGVFYASPEFAKLGGDQNVLTIAPDVVVRLHSAQAAELDKLPLAEAVDRYSRAARERGMRVLLIRPVSFAAPAPFDSLSAFVAGINRAVQGEGLSMGRPHPFEDSNVPTWLFLLIGLSTAPVAYFVGAAFIERRSVRIAGAVLAVAIGALAATHHGRPYSALLAALAFPIAAFLVLDAKKRPNLILDFIVVSLVSLVGGLAVAGLLNGLPYFIRAEQFEGVKVAVFLPVFLVFYYFLHRGADLKKLMQDRMTWGAALLGLVILGVLLFMSSRTGNDNPAGVSDLELKLRFILDKVLIVRPRTKEFLVGHPLLIVGIGLLAIQRARPDPRLAIWAAIALAGGAIGQTDIVNTMCHIHTPVMLSLARIGVGMAAGCIMGLAVWAIVRRWLPAGEA